MFSSTFTSFCCFCCFLLRFAVFSFLLFFAACGCFGLLLAAFAVSGQVSPARLAIYSFLCLSLGFPTVSCISLFPLAFSCFASLHVLQHLLNGFLGIPSLSLAFLCLPSPCLVLSCAAMSLKIRASRSLAKTGSRRWVLGRFFRSFFVSVSNFVFYSIFNRFSTVSGRVSGRFWHAPGRFRECSFRRPKCLSSFDRF